MVSLLVIVFTPVVIISLIGALIADKKLPWCFCVIKLYFFPPPKKSRISIVVTIPISFPLPGSVIGTLLKSFLLIKFAISIMDALWDAVTTSLKAISIISPSVSAFLVICKFAGFPIVFILLINLFRIISSPVICYRIIWMVFSLHLIRLYNQNIKIDRQPLLVDHRLHIFHIHPHPSFRHSLFYS